MPKKPLCEFGQEVKLELMLQGQTQEWLIQQVKAKLNIFFDRWYLNKILTGEKKAVKIRGCIQEVLGIAERRKFYETQVPQAQNKAF